MLALPVLACGALPEVELEASGETTSEDGGSVELAIALARMPRGIITVEARSSDLSEGAVSEPVRFDRTNWNESQIIVVTGVDDAEDDGDVAYSVELHVSSSRAPGAEPVLLETIALENRDDDDAPPEWRASFSPMGDLPGGAHLSHAAAVNADARVVVGWSEGEVGVQAVRWLVQFELQALSDQQSRAYGVSPNGLLIAGASAGGSYSGGIWRAPGAFEPRIWPASTPGAPVMGWLVRGEVVLDDGRVFGQCVQQGGFGAWIGCRFDAPGQLDFLPLSELHAADALGNFAGYSEPESLPSRPIGSVARFNDAALGYPSDDCFVPHRCRSAARAFAQAGTFIVGTASVPEGGVDGDTSGPFVDVAFLYVEGEGMRALPDLEGGDDASGAYAIDEAGTVVGGYGTDESGRQAVLWVDDTAYALRDLLSGPGGAAADGWRLEEITDITPDGRVAVGNGFNADGAPEGFLVSLSAPPSAISSADP